MEDPIPRLLRETGGELDGDAPKRFKPGVEWDWRELTRVLIHATALFEDAPAKAVRYYDPSWVNGEIRRLARTDLDAALTFRDEVLELCDEDYDAALEFFKRLAERDGKDALGHGLGDGPPGAIAMPRVIGAGLGGVVFPEASRAFLDGLDGDGYAPHILFGHLVDFALRNGLVDLLSETLNKGGPHGWQIAQAATPILGLSEVREDESFDAMLELCLGRYEPGPVAGRDASDGGVHAGQCERRPDWLDFDDPKPIEWQVVAAAIDSDAP